jgi:hypothetical protein
MKSEWLAQAAETNVFGSTYFVWQDMDHWMHPRWRVCGKTWPNTTFVAEQLPPGKMLFLRLYAYPTEFRLLSLATQLPMDNKAYFDVCIGGGIFLGTREAVLAWRDAYFKVVDDEVRLGFFIGKDQTQHLHTCTRHLELCHIVQAPWVHWKYLQVYLTGDPRNQRGFPLEPRIIAPDNRIFMLATRFYLFVISFRSILCSKTWRRALCCCGPVSCWRWPWWAASSTAHVVAGAWVC